MIPAILPLIFLHICPEALIICPDASINGQFLLTSCMRNLKLIPILIVAFLASCSHSATSFRAPEAQKDAVLDTVSSMLMKDVAPERILSVVDSAETAGLFDSVHAELLRAKVYGHNERDLARARAICEELLHTRNLGPGAEADILEHLCYLCRMRSDDFGLIEYGLRFKEVCQGLGDPLRSVPVEADMGAARIRLGRTEEGLATLDQAIVTLDQVDRFSQMDAGIRVRKSKIHSLIDLDRYLDIVPVAEQIIGRLEDFASRPEEFDDASPNLPDDRSRPGYIDFYTGQARAFMMYAYASAGMIKEAREQETLFEKTAYSRSYNGRKMASNSWPMLGEYAKMLSFYEELENRWGADTLHQEYAIMLENKALAAKAQGRTRDALDYMTRYSSLMSRLNESESKETARLFEVKYREKDRQLAMERKLSEGKRTRMLVVALSIIVVLLALFLGLLLRDLAAIRRKNKVLKEQISENVSHQKHEIQAQGKSADPDFSSMSDAQLFEYLRYVIVTEELYTDSRLDRQQLMDRFHLSKEKIGAAFSHGSPYQSLAAFLNVVRLKSAAKKLSSRPEMSISDVAAACGFSSGSLFARNFKQYFALTPTEFRRNPECTDRS